MTRFRPCIDLHQGQVKQIVGGTLTDDAKESPKTNFVAQQSAGHFAELYMKDALTGGHVIKLGPNNDDAAREAVQAWPSGLQVGGGITDENAAVWVCAGAEKIIVTSWLFKDGVFAADRAQKLVDLVTRDRIVIDLSCRRKPDQEGWFVAINRWQTVTDLEITKETLESLAQYAAEYLVHAADVEGLCQGIDEDLVARLGEWSPIPCTYAGGAKDISDLDLVKRLSGGRVDLTLGSALDIFGGSGVTYEAAVAWNAAEALAEQADKAGAAEAGSPAQ